ncbi:hypothetical protein [Ancylobacter polymorphus]|uniref:Uncharacterized protein n=1 Tax=Ancylobacter polymorphus TaxID=223390 RepID=A0A9E6ZR31_9HYPH|nr:hypothetical protein [Ancylobacter polymorphus]UOK70199.1 hypothetical protein K9D25_15880 [Ancylobacter polymorphus]
MADFLLGNLGGVTRLRTCLPGQDVENINLDERYVTFDSTWPNAFRLIDNNVVSAASLSNLTVNYAGGATRRVKLLPSSGSLVRPVLAWARRGSGSLQYISGGVTRTQAYQRGYRQCGVSLRTAFILLSPQLSGVDYVYFIFGNNASSPEDSGTNGFILGNHPLHGRGLFVSRPGAVIETAGIDDMTVATKKNVFQIAETGQCASSGLALSDPMADPVLATGSGPVVGFVDLEGSYPHYPPVIVYFTTNAGGIACSAYWINPSRIMLTGGTGVTNFRFAVVATDPAYRGGVDSTEGVRRWHYSPATGLVVTKHDVHFDLASQTDYIFRSDRLTPYIKAYEQIPASRPFGAYNIPAPPPVGAGLPFAFFLHYKNATGDWWCGCGYSGEFDKRIFNTTIDKWVPQDTMNAYVSARDKYTWLGASSSTLTAFATMNVSDF